jgi:hypothetical protein
MAHPYASKAKTGQELADARYDFPPNKSAPDSLLCKDAVVTSRGEQPEDNFTKAPSRQISETGKVRK